MSSRQSDQPEPGGLYVHIPFCVRKCPYCDFFSITDSNMIPDFIGALLKEIEMVAGRTDAADPFDTLYIGGGTPSMLEGEDILRIVETVHRVFRLLPNAEITMEVNPGTVVPAQLKAFRYAGINRINIGVQSFRNDRLKFLGRIHSDKDAHQAIKWAREAGFENLGLDMIYGIPGQTKASWLWDMQEAAAYQPEHLSCYMLTCEAGTPLDKDRQQGLFLPMDDVGVSNLFGTTLEFLTAKGYDPYEISNFERATPLGRHANRSRHNQKYWTYAPYLGFGPSAHSFIDPVRHWNVRDVGAYISETAAGRLPLADKEVLSRDQQMIEWIYLGLRQTDGIPVGLFNRRFDADFYADFREEIENLEAEGLMVADETTCALTAKGFLLLDSIIDRLI